VTMLVLSLLSWLIVESSQNIIINGIPTFGVFVYKLMV
jgi:hypothetical protein